MSDSLNKKAGYTHKVTFEKEVHGIWCKGTCPFPSLASAQRYCETLSRNETFRGMTITELA